MVMKNIITSIKDHMTDNPDDDYISTVHKLRRERTDTDDYHGHVLARKRRAGRCKEVLSPFISSAVPGMLQISPQVNILCQLYYYPYHNHYYNLYLHDCYYLLRCPWNVANITASKHLVSIIIVRYPSR